MKYAVGYLRVSTQEQGRSGLGLAAQRQDIERFAEREGVLAQVLVSGCANGSRSRCVASTTGTCGGPEEGEAGALPVDAQEGRQLEVIKSTDSCSR